MCIRDSLRSVKGCIRLDHKKNEDVRQELKVQPVTELAKNYKKDGKSMLRACRTNLFDQPRICESLRHL